ncbi:hypothetical protein F4780DRAFT_730089 [Xylariomycetidae sp. FL0641]|nr:hypothetical protein F4780DRAFT_730089 [Xylariomycetidae sp. FL0641]
MPLATPAPRALSTEGDGSNTTPPPSLISFAPPSSCGTNFFEFNTDGGSSSYYEQGPRAAQHSCFPSGYSVTSDFFYSPGWCPDGYTEACSSELVVAPRTETHFTCCPS